MLHLACPCFCYILLRPARHRWVGYIALPKKVMYATRASKGWPWWLNEDSWGRLARATLPSRYSCLGFSEWRCKSAAAPARACIQINHALMRLALCVASPVWAGPWIGVPPVVLVHLAWITHSSGYRRRDGASERMTTSCWGGDQGPRDEGAHDDHLFDRAANGPTKR